MRDSAQERKNRIKNEESEDARVDEDEIAQDERRAEGKNIAHEHDLLWPKRVREPSSAYLTTQTQYPSYEVEKANRRERDVPRDLKINCEEGHRG